MSVIERHLEQISLSADSIANLQFPPPKIFTNALLHTPDITYLIRDTETHERALFSVPPTPQPISSSSKPAPASSLRRQTVFNVAHGEVTAPRQSIRAPRQNTAVAAVLGPELHREMKIAESRPAGEANVEVLLRGVEKLNAVYNFPGVVEQIQDLSKRYEQVSWEITHYEDKVGRQTNDLERINRGNLNMDEESDHDDGELSLDEHEEYGQLITDEDIRKEENEIRELESRKKELEDSIRGMERDLGSLRK